MRRSRLSATYDVNKSRPLITDFIDRQLSMRATLLTALALTGFSAVPCYGAPTLNAGTYAMLAYVTKVAPTGKATCDYKVGETWTDYFVYPGPNKVGATKKKLIQSSTDHYVGIDVYPKTPTAGETTWSGTYHYYYLPSGNSGTGKFNWRFNIIDSTDFVLTRTFTSETSSGVCIVTVDESALRTGD
jgi:hypothetical protein